MVELIQKLLLTNNCVIIPNFGAFIGNYNPSEIRLQDNKILPPRKAIAFNRSLQNNDGLLINALANQFSISYHEAEIKVTDFAKQHNDLLNEFKSLILKDIGRLILDDDNKILFQPYNSKNYLLDSFGLQEMSLEPIYRLKDEESAIKDKYQRILHPELMGDALKTPRKTSKAGYWFTSILAMLFIGSTLTWNIHKVNSHQNVSSLMPVFEKVPVQPSAIRNIDTVTDSATVGIVQDEPKEEIKVVETNLADLPLNKTYVVIGAFFTVNRAEKLKIETEKKGYTVNIIKDNSTKLFHTTILLENLEADNILPQIKSDINPRAWIYCVKCRL